MVSATNRIPEINRDNSANRVIERIVNLVRRNIANVDDKISGALNIRIMGRADELEEAGKSLAENQYIALGFIKTRQKKQKLNIIAL